MRHHYNSLKFISLKLLPLKVSILPDYPAGIIIINAVMHKALFFLLHNSVFIVVGFVSLTTCEVVGVWMTSLCIVKWQSSSYLLWYIPSYTTFLLMTFLTPDISNLKTTQAYCINPTIPFCLSQLQQISDTVVTQTQSEKQFIFMSCRTKTKCNVNIPAAGVKWSSEVFIPLRPHRVYIIHPMKPSISSFHVSQVSRVDCERKSMTSAHLPASHIET